MVRDGTEWHRCLGLSADKSFTLIRDLERGDSAHDLAAGTRLFMLDIVLVGRTPFARVSVDGADTDACLVALSKLF